MVTQIEQDTQDSINYFSRHFRELGYSDGHFVFACHAAVPIALTADLLYQLWANFQDYTGANGMPAKIDPMAISDVLMANFCRHVGQEIFEMDMEARAYLLNSLRNDPRFGEMRMRETAVFLEQYMAAQAAGDYPSTYREAQLWAAKVVLQPQEAAHEISASLSGFVQKGNETEIMRMRLLLESYANQNSSFEGLLHFSKGLKAHLLDLEEEIVQEQFEQAKAFIASDDFSSHKFTLTIPVFDALKDKLSIPTEAYQEAMNRIKQAQTQKEDTLNLSGLALHELPPALFELTHLTELDISDNRLTEWPQQLSTFLRLQKLVVSKNPLRQIPDWFRQLGDLRVLNMDDAQVRYLPESIFRLRKLQELSLKNNNIDFVPEEITGLPVLRSINFHGNPVANLPEDRLDCTADQLKDYFEGIPVMQGDKPVILSCRSKVSPDFNPIEEIFSSPPVQPVFLNDPTPVDLYRTLKTYRNQVVILDYPGIAWSFQKQASASPGRREIPIQFFSQLQNLKILLPGTVVTNSQFPAFLEQVKVGIVAAVGLVSNDMEAQFEKSFYQALKQGSTLEEALELANHDIRQPDIPMQRSVSVSENVSQYALFLPVAISREDLNSTLLEQITSADIKGYFNTLYQHVSHNFQRSLMTNIQNEYLELQERLEKGEIPYDDFTKLFEKNIIALTDAIYQIKQEDLIVIQISKWRLVTRQDLSESLTNPIARLPVSVIGNRAEKERFFKLYQSLKPSAYLRLQSDAGSTSFQLQIQKDQMVIKETKDNKLIHGIHKVDADTVVYIVKKLEQIEKWQRIYNLQNRFTGLSDDLIKIRIESGINKQRERYKGNTINLTYDGKEIPYDIFIENDSKQRVFADVLDLTEQYGILKLPGNESYKVIEPGQEVKMFGGYFSISAQDSSDPGLFKFSVTDIFKFIVSTNKFDLKKYAERGLKPKVVAKVERTEAYRSIDFSLDSESPDHDWFTKSVQVVVSLGEESVWRTVREGRTPAMLNRYLQLFPQGKFVAEANAKLNELTREKIERTSFETFSKAGNIDLENLPTETRKLIGQGRLKEALSLLKEKTDNNDDILILMSRLNDLEKKSRMGVISYSESNIERNRLTSATLDFINTLTERGLVFSSSSGSTQALEIDIEVELPSGKRRTVTSMQELKNVLREFGGDLRTGKPDYFMDDSLRYLSRSLDNIYKWILSSDMEKTNPQVVKEFFRTRELMGDIIVLIEIRKFDGFSKRILDLRDSLERFAETLPQNGYA